MTPDRSRAIEKLAIREALAKSTATESIGRKLGDELIAVAREVVAATRDMKASAHRMEVAIERLEQLIGKP